MPQTSPIYASSCCSRGINSFTLAAKLSLHMGRSITIPLPGKDDNRSGKRLLLRADDRTVWAVPPLWTDSVPPDPEVVIGQGRTLLGVVDLLALASLVTRLSQGEGW